MRTDTEVTTCPTCEGRKVELIRGVELQCDTCQGWGVLDPTPNARLTKVGPARQSSRPTRGAA